jgi:predicted phage baseplate assembly protein
VIFELNDTVTIPAGVSSAFEYATQGVTVTNDVVGVSTGAQGEKFKLSYPDVLVDSLVVMTNENGVVRKLERVRDFLSSSPTDLHYITTADEYNNITIEFGNGTTGITVPRDSIVFAEYRVGGGRIGNVGANTITEFATSAIAGLSLTNPEIPYQYGSDVEDIEHAKLVAPRYYRSTNRAVTKDDFEDLALMNSGVTKAKAIETFNANGDINIYVVPTDYATVPEQLRTQILNSINANRIINVTPVILDPVYKDFSIEVNVIAYSDYVNSTIKAEVESILLDVFDKKYIEFDEEIYVASIYKEIMSIEGIRNASIVSPVSDITVTGNEIARLTGVTVTVQGGVDA